MSICVKNQAIIIARAFYMHPGAGGQRSAVVPILDHILQRRRTSFSQVARLLRNSA